MNTSHDGCVTSHVNTIKLTSLNDMSFVRSIFASKRPRVTETREERQRNGQNFDPFRPSTSATSSFIDTICERVPRELDEEAMRIVIVREEDRMVLFDSKTIIPNVVVPPSPRLSITKQQNGPTPKSGTQEKKRISPCGRFLLKRHSNDVKQISEMLFGAMMASTGSDSLKIHTIGETHSIMTSRIFFMPRARTSNLMTDSATMISDTESQFDVMNQSIDGIPSMTAPPEKFCRFRNCSLQEGDAKEEMRPFSPPSRISRVTRRMLSYRSDLTHEGSAVRWKSRSRLSSCGSSHTDDEFVRKVALGVLWDEGEKAFVFGHMALLEGELVKLESRIETAATAPKDFLFSVHQAWREFIETVRILVNTPRLKHPVWLSMVDGNEGLVASFFCDTLASLARDLDKKETHFFLSNLISAVLMHHMSWVASVAPPVSKQSTSLSGSRRSLVIGSTVNEEAPFAPYNIHMAQYLEVVGNIGAKGRTARTLVIGEKEKSEMVGHLLHVLSYFVRCSAIKRQSEESTGLYDLAVEEAFSPPIVSPCDSVMAISPRSNNLESSSPDKVRDDDGMSSSSADSIGPPPAIRPRVGSGTPAITIPLEKKFDRRKSRGTLLESDGSESENDMARSLGRSLLVGPSSSYSPHFVLSGILKNESNTDIEILNRLKEDLRSSSLSEDLLCPQQSISSSSSTDSPQITESVVVFADVTDWSVKIVSTNNGVESVASPSEAVVSMIEQFVDFHSAGFAPKFLLSHLEDCLQELLAKSQALVEMVQSRSSANHSTLLSPERVGKVVDCDVSDLRLLLNVAAVYSPSILESAT
ncbi:unnamed protein product, partial [Mesorhabditis belari]|uniref:UDENN FNIP1/2-type domain-containing protein n=1 Tax=Mesorhabditis belari TaxID=2138241 RepID=A0AAF3EYM6_9BILA